MQLVGIVINFYQHDSQKKTQRMLHDKVRWIWFIVYNIIEHSSHKITIYTLRIDNPIIMLHHVSMLGRWRIIPEIE